MEDFKYYQISEDGRIVYVPEVESSENPIEYTVWGICERGFIHGVGMYLKRKDIKCDYYMIGEPTRREFEHYQYVFNESRRWKNGYYLDDDLDED